MIEFRLEEHIDKSGSDTTLYRQDMRSKFGYVTLSDVRFRHKQDRW
jgi:hypothetical protein